MVPQNLQVATVVGVAAPSIKGGRSRTHPSILLALATATEAEGVVKHLVAEVEITAGGITVTEETGDLGGGLIEIGANMIAIKGMDTDIQGGRAQVATTHQAGGIVADLRICVVDLIDEIVHLVRIEASRVLLIHEVHPEVTGAEPELASRAQCPRK